MKFCGLVKRGRVRLLLLLLLRAVGDHLRCGKDGWRWQWGGGSIWRLKTWELDVWSLVGQVVLRRRRNLLHKR